MASNTISFYYNSSCFREQPITERNYGIDLLRVLSMFYVLILHALLQGGILGTVEEGSPQYMFSWLLEIWALGAVDIFALISGYVSYNESEKKVNFSNYIVLWLQVIIYGVSITLLFELIHPELVTKYDLLEMFFPVTNKLYWYFTSYTGLILLMPLLNAGLRKCTEQSLRKMFVVIIIVFSIYDTVVDRFQLADGYSFIWLVLLYTLGGIVKKCNIGSHIKVYQAFFAIALCCLLGWGWKMYGIEFDFFNISVTRSLSTLYTSPTILIASLFYIIGFSKLNFHPILKKIISFSSAGAFAAYILNCQRFIWEYVMKQRFVYLSDKNLMAIFVHIITFSVVFLTISIFIDHVRIWLFKCCRIKELADCMVRFADKILSRWC